MRLKLFKAFGSNRSSLHMFITKHTLAAFSVPRLPATLQNNLSFSIRKCSDRNSETQRKLRPQATCMLLSGKLLVTAFPFPPELPSHLINRKGCMCQKRTGSISPTPAAPGISVPPLACMVGLAPWKTESLTSCKGQDRKEVSYSDLQSERGVL